MSKRHRFIAMAIVTILMLGSIGVIAVYNQPVPEADLAKQAEISEEKAAEIAFADLIKSYGNVLENKNLSEVQWTAVKEAIQQRLVWTITIENLIRTDFQTPTRKWSVKYRVDIQTGEIFQIMHAS